MAEFVKQAKFPFVSANLNFGTEPALSPMANSGLGKPGEEGKIYPAVIKEIGGEKVGIIGLTTPESSVLSSPGPTLSSMMKWKARKSRWMRWKRKASTKLSYYRIWVIR
ncbi:hypothetical protein HMSSN036_02090 [Paenibacillus macerans]|nr:hypothetical protein HMSSN036_02090 [Paenibacillus macerans]